MSRDISKLHPFLQQVIPLLIADASKEGLPVLITNAVRTQQEQNALYAKGRTASGSIVTNARYPDSLHCWGCAFDFCRNVKGREYDDSDEFFEKVAHIAKDTYHLEWGGDWKRFPDKPHLQMSGFTVEHLKKSWGSPEQYMATWHGSDTPEFFDVPDNAWYQKDVIWAIKKGLMQGYPDGTFRPDRFITRAELAAVLHRLEDDNV